QFATITMDITKIIEFQEILYAKNKELENYLYIASHDLRSPLVNIQGFSKRLETIADKIAEIIETESNPEAQKQQLNKIIDNELPKTLKFIFSGVAKMDKLINGLLQLSRTGRSQMNIQQVDMEQLFRNILQTFNFQLEKNGAIINISTLKPCYGDADLLNQLFSNIIGNAIKYRDQERKLKIDISSRVMGKRVIYSISDNGIGISPRHIDRIWDIFFRGKPDQEEAGDGIGLSLVKRIVDKHKGNIRVESQVDIGTTFFIELHKNKFSNEGNGVQNGEIQRT
ncbi:MAG: sensor histidine kinase, partial [Fidelibacterota bacterium]